MENKIFLFVFSGAIIGICVAVVLVLFVFFTWLAWKRNYVRLKTAVLAKEKDRNAVLSQLTNTISQQFQTTIGARLHVETIAGMIKDGQIGAMQGGFLRVAGDTQYQIEHEQFQSLSVAVQGGNAQLRTAEQAYISAGEAYDVYRQDPWVSIFITMEEIPVKPLLSSTAAAAVASGNYSGQDLSFNQPAAK